MRTFYRLCRPASHYNLCFCMKVEEGTLLWTPPPARLARSHLTRYLRWLADRGRQFDDYEALWRWSVADLEAFWCSIAEFCGIEFSTTS